jgi:hypothetical protein
MSKNVSHLASRPPGAPVLSDTGSGARVLLAETLHDALDALGAELSAHGWTAHVRALPGRVPGLRASNPEPGAAVLSEDIYAKPGPDGRWEYWWPWAERIAGDPAGAAAVIVRVLRPAGTP